MKKGFKLSVLVLLSAMLFIGCAQMPSQERVENYVSSAVDKAAKKVTDQIKNAVKKELKEFFDTEDLVASLGISSHEIDKIKNSIQTYVDNYEFDEQALKEAKASVEGILQNAQGMSAEEIQLKIDEVFNTEN